MIEEIAVKNYGCLRDVRARLAPLHAFVGPNDSGKSTLLRALRTAVQFASGTFDEGKSPFDPALSNGTSIEVTSADISQIAVSPDGQLLAAGDWSGNVTLWDLRTHERVGNGGR